MSSDKITEQTGYLAPLHRNRDFRRLWVGQACAELAAHGSALAYTLLALELTGSPFQAGLVGAAGLAASTVLSLPAGAVVDRWDRRRTMVGCEVVRALALGAVGVAVLAGLASLPLLIAAAVVERGGSALFLPAQTAALRHIVPARQLPRAAARIEARAYAAELAGPPLGGALFGLARTIPFLTGALAYLASLVAVVLIRRPLQQTRTAPPERLTASIAGGIRFVLAEPFLRASLILAAVFNLALGGVFFTLIVALQQRGLPPAGIGVAQASLAAGGLLGALAAPWIQPRLRAPVLIISMTWLAVALVAATAALAGTYLLTVPLVLALLLAPSLNATTFAYQVAITPDAMQGRVDNTIGMLAQALNPIGPLLAGLLIEQWKPATAFATFAATLAAAALIATTSKGIRTMRPIEAASQRETTSAPPLGLDTSGRQQGRVPES